MKSKNVWAVISLRWYSAWGESGLFTREIIYGKEFFFLIFGVTKLILDALFFLFGKIYWTNIKLSGSTFFSSFTIDNLPQNLELGILVQRSQQVRRC